MNEKTETVDPVEAAKNEAYERNQAFMADLGRQYPYEFISCMATDALATVRAWLLANGAPAAIIELLEYVYLLPERAAAARAGALNEWGALSLAEYIPETARLIAENGGVFHDADGETAPRKSMTE